MEITITYGCGNCNNTFTETFSVRRGQRIVRDCDFCGQERILEIQANRQVKRHKTLCERCTTDEPEIRKKCTANCEEHERERTPKIK